MRVLLSTTATPDDRKTLCCARALARAGAWVAVGSDRFWGQAYYSRFVRRRVRYPHPRLGVSEFIAALDRHIESEGCDVVLPMNDYTTWALTHHRGDLSAAVATALPPASSLETVEDKADCLEIAHGLGIETPISIEIANRRELLEAGERLGYPCVLKLRRGSGAVGFRVIHGRNELITAYETPHPPSDPTFDRDHLLVQEYIPGETRDACFLCDRGQPRAELTQRRLRSYPRDGGVGTLVETTHEPRLLERGRSVLAALDWHGPAQVEFKVDPKTDRTWLIEINGRFWGSLDLAVHAGVDFPLYTCRLALGQSVSTQSIYPVGLQFRWPFPFGLLAMGTRGSRLQAAWEFFGPRRDIRSDLVWNDPLPLAAEALYIGRRGWERGSLRPSKDRV